jgi:hypothetical protein
LHAGLRDGALQQDDVLLLCLADLEQVGDLLLVETELLEVAGGELGEALLVECRLEPLECEGAVRCQSWGIVSKEISGESYN